MRSLLRAYSDMTRVLIKRGNLDTDAHRGKCPVEMEAEME